MTKKITKHQTLSNALWSYFELLKAEIVDKSGIEPDTVREDSEHLKNLQRISELLGIKGLKSACIAAGANDQDFQKMREAFKLNRKMNSNDQDHFDLRQTHK